LSPMSSESQLVKLRAPVARRWAFPTGGFAHVQVRSRGCGVGVRHGDGVGRGEDDPEEAGNKEG